MTKKISNEELVARIRAGQNIKGNMEQLYNQNLPLIRQFIKPFLGYEDEADLLQQAYLGLYRSIEMYESSENVKFMTYSKYWIQQEVRRYLENSGSLIRVPSHKKQQAIQYKRFLQEYEREYGRPPSDLEAAGDLGISPDELALIRMSLRGVTSLDAPIKTDKADDEISLGDTIADSTNMEDDTINRIHEESVRKELWDIVRRYTDETQGLVVVSYYRQGKTLAQIGEELGISIERVRQLKAAGLRQLRRHKALTEIKQKCEVIEADIYRTGLRNFKQSGSSVETIIMRLEELEEQYRVSIM